MNVEFKSGNVSSVCRRVLVCLREDGSPECEDGCVDSCV